MNRMRRMNDRAKQKSERGRKEERQQKARNFRYVDNCMLGLNYDRHNLNS